MTDKNLQHQVEAWNQASPVGTTVEYRSLIDGPVTFTGKTRSEAQILSGHTVVVWLEGKAGCVCVEHCTPLADELPGSLLESNGKVSEDARYCGSGPRCRP